MRREDEDYEVAAEALSKLAYRTDHALRPANAQADLDRALGERVRRLVEGGTYIELFRLDDERFEVRASDGIEYNCATLDEVVEALAARLDERSTQDGDT